MVRRLQDICGIREKEELWAIGRGFIVRDLPWTEKKLRELPPFEFENSAVIALGGRKNKPQFGNKPDRQAHTRPCHSRLRAAASASMSPAKASSLVDTRVIYCGNNLEQLQKLPAVCVPTS
jgi:hypothetical protein